ncbi:hypothetical protein [Sphingopyxis granuli]|uniref:hypothetical protein n=1 Tax=Sphingopyxis granuli TaxID=267128 RepID=UPI001B312C8C|nr:hypothetical protein [Sphingopyxis granuli]
MPMHRRKGLEQSGFGVEKCPGVWPQMWLRSRIELKNDMVSSGSRLQSNPSLSSIFFLVRGRVVDGKIHRQAVETQRRGHKLAS